MIVELKTASTAAKIDSKGAELISLCDASGHEFMWQKDAKYWGRSSPVLFPIVGNLRDDKTIIAGTEYTMAKHGFCRDAAFEIISQTDTEVSLCYTYNEETLKLYPYRFALILSYSLSDESIQISYTVKNLDDKPIDFCLGAHPAFNIPMEKGEKFEDYVLRFNRAETAGCPVFDFEKNEINVNNRIDYTKGGTEIPLNYDLFDTDAIMFDKLASDSVQICSKVTGHGVRVSFEGFPFVAFWTPIKLQAPFICIEPWSGMAACSDEDNHYENKRGITHLERNEKAAFSLTIFPMK